MEHMKKAWKQMVAIIIVLVISVKALEISKNVAAMEAARQSVLVVDPVKALIATMIMMVLGVVVYLIRKE